MPEAIKNVDGAIAQAELSRRHLARRHLVDFSTYLHPWYRPYRHHKMLGEYLEQVETYIRTGGAEGIGRLMVFEPPRHGKSEQISKLFPAWLLGREPDSRIILTSYNGDLATSNSRKARDYVMDPRFAAIFGDKANKADPVELSDDSRSVTSWDLSYPHRGGVVAAGVGGGITGKGAHLFVVDDPFKDREAAESERERERVWNWWTSTASTRFQRGGAAVVVQTRWHTDDLAGKLIQAMASNPAADRWTILSLPAIWEKPEPPEDQDFDRWAMDMMLNGVYIQDADPLGRDEGAALWPEEFPGWWLENKRENIGPYDWLSLYMQTPVNREGAMFQADWFDLVDRIPTKVMARVRYWDKAGTDGSGDYTVGVLISLTVDGHYYVENVVRKQLSYYQRNQLMMNVIDQDMTLPGPVTREFQEVENGSAGQEAAVNTVKEIKGRPLQFDKVGNKSKEIRALALAGAAEAGLVHLVRGPWNAKFREEMVLFPKGSHDDQVDAASGAFNKIARSGRSGVH
jgi:predicted phage terminase large subunit-like protein